MQVHISQTQTTVSVTSPFNTEFVAKARKLGGKWNSSAWVFDARDEERVRELCREYYGSDGISEQTCTLRISYVDGAGAYQGPLTVHGRVIARATGRDSGAKLGESVIVLSGGFGSGGSAKNWTTYAHDNTVVLVRDFPRAVAERLVLDKPGKYAIEPETAPIDRGKLVEERALIAKRLAEIDALLAGTASYE